MECFRNTEFYTIMKASVFEDPILFHFICHYSMFLELIKQADELNRNIAVDSFSLQVNAPVVF